MPAGRPTDYSEEMSEEICLRVASGRSVSSVCADLDMPDNATIYRWRQKHPEFRDKLAQARDERLEADADQIRALARRVMEEGDLDYQRVNCAVNAIDKAARLMAPKTRVEVSGKDGGVIKTEDVSGYDIARRIAFALASAKPSGE